jgi:hypothetical protein
MSKRTAKAEGISLYRLSGDAASDVSLRQDFSPSQLDPKFVNWPVHTARLVDRLTRK